MSIPTPCIVPKPHIEYIVMEILLCYGSYRFGVIGTSPGISSQMIIKQEQCCNEGRVLV